MSTAAQYLIVKRRKLPVVSAVVCVGVSVSLAFVKVAISRGFGASDMVPFFLWTIPLGILIALLNASFTAFIPRLSSLLKYLMMGIIGLVTGAFWTYLVAVWLGPYFGAFSFGVLTCWVVGAASGLIVGLDNYKEANYVIVIDLAIVIVMGFGAIVGEGPLMRLFLDSQEVEVVTVKWTPGPEPLTNPSVLGHSLPERDLERLKAIGLTGRLEYASSGRFGKGKRGRVIIVIARQLKESVALPQPDGNEIIYVQSEDGWKMYPPKARTIGRNIQLWPDEREPERVTRYFVENADGTRQGGTLATW